MFLKPPWFFVLISPSTIRKAVLKREGLLVGRARIQTAMREMGIEGIHPGPNLSKRALEHKIYPSLLRNVTPQHPHHIW